MNVNYLFKNLIGSIALVPMTLDVMGKSICAKPQRYMTISSRDLCDEEYIPLKRTVKDIRLACVDFVPSSTPMKIHRIITFSLRRYLVNVMASWKLGTTASVREFHSFRRSPFMNGQGRFHVMSECRGLRLWSRPKSSSSVKTIPCLVLGIIIRFTDTSFKPNLISTSQSDVGWEHITHIFWQLECSLWWEKRRQML